MATILRHTTVVRDGWHNAFTDLAYWRGCYWVSYRKGAGHISQDAECVIAVSPDRARFREVARLHAPGDNRDPKLVVMGDRLACIFPTWQGGHEKRHLQQLVSFSEDGFAWSAPRRVMQPHWWLWRVVPFQGKYYGAAYTYNNGGAGPDRTYRTDWVVSDDMLDWRIVSPIGGAEHSLGEAGFHFFPDGEVWLISRRAVPSTAPAFFASSKPPYTQWQLTELDRAIHSPAMIEHKGSIYVAGRRIANTLGETTFPHPTVWSLGVWRVTPGKVEPLLHIPATGDCAYPGMIVAPDGVACLTYYSQHAYHLGVVPPPTRVAPNIQGGTPESLGVADVYFAELALP